MAKTLFITGTGTDVGKTYVTALIVKRLRDMGINAGYYKAALSGAEEKDGRLIPGDAEFVCKASGIKESAESLVSYIYKTPVSPHLAARLEGEQVRMEKIREDFCKISQKYDYVTMEGSGGIVCPIRYDGKKILLEDIIKELSLPALIIADAGLGTINSVVLTVEYMRLKDIPISGIILNRFHGGDVMEEDNKEMIKALTGIEVLGTVEDGILNIDDEVLKGFYK